jgi:hypothetical protein
MFGVTIKDERLLDFVDLPFVLFQTISRGRFGVGHPRTAKRSCVYVVFDATLKPPVLVGDSALR